MDNNEPKKISFGFSKSSKKTNLLVRPQPIEEKKVDIIEYLEEKSIKVVGGDDDKPKGPLVIPMKQPNKKLINLVEIVKNDFQEPGPETIDETKAENGKTDEDQKLAENLTLEEQAARELLNASNIVEVKEENKRVIDVSTKNTEKITFEGEKESTIDDYEDIPVEEFGKAMLRGMGWKDGHGIGKNEQLIKVSQPVQRPKGMGLGADKMTKQDKNEKPALDRDGNALKCVKGAFIKVIAGYHKGNYGQIIGLDDESGRFIIKTALNNLNVSLNEFLVTPVTKDEYTKNSKVINNAKYEEYLKKKELEEQIKLKQASIKKESDSDSSEEDKNRSRKDKSDKKDKNYDRSDSEEDRKRKDKNGKHVKKERKSSESDVEDDRSRRKEKYDRDIKKDRRSTSKEKYSRKEKYEKRPIKKERRSSESDYESRRSTSEEKYSRKEKYEKRPIKKERRSSESDYEDRRSRKDKHEKSSKYDSDNYKKEESRDRKNRDRKKQSKSKSKHYSSESEEEPERRKSKKKSSKYDSDSDDYEQSSSKKKHKKKKSKKHSSDSDEEKYRRKSKKSDRKKYDESDSEYEAKHKKDKKKDKHHEKRERSRHDKERK